MKLNFSPLRSGLGKAASQGRQTSQGQPLENSLLDKEINTNLLI